MKSVRTAATPSFRCASSASVASSPARPFGRIRACGAEVLADDHGVGACAVQVGRDDAQRLGRVSAGLVLGGGGEDRDVHRAGARLRDLVLHPALLRGRDLLLRVRRDVDGVVGERAHGLLEHRRRPRRRTRGRARLLGTRGGRGGDGACGGAAADQEPQLRSVLPRQRGIRERNLVPEPRGADPRLPADSLRLLARGPEFRNLHTCSPARSVGGKRGRPLRPAPPRRRDPARFGSPERSARPPRLDRACAGLGRDPLFARARRRQRVRGPGIPGAHQRPRPAARSAVGGRAQLDDVQPRAGVRPGARGAVGEAPRDPGVVRDQLGVLSSPRGRGGARDDGAPPARDPPRDTTAREPSPRPAAAAPARVPADRHGRRLRVRPDQHRGAGLRPRVRQAGHVVGGDHRRLRRRCRLRRVPARRPGRRLAAADGPHPVASSPPA